MQRFDIDKGRMIYHENGKYILYYTHKKIINNLHALFNLQGIKIVTPQLFSIINRKETYSVMQITDISVESEQINNIFMTYESHVRICESIEKQLFQD